MKKLIVLFLLFSVGTAYASPPSRSYSYTSGDTISSTQVTTNEDNIYNYLQGGVDTIKDGSIVNADINASANIQAGKLNLSAITQNISNTGTLANTGNVTITGTLDASSMIEADWLSLPETSAPTTGASEGGLYTKDTSGQPELFFREESAGDEVQLTTGGKTYLGARDEIVKAWVNFNGATGAVNDDYNVTSVTDNGTGDFTINFTTAFADANYACACMGLRDGTNVGVCTAKAQAAGTLRVITGDMAANLMDFTNVQVICFGDQ